MDFTVSKSSGAYTAFLASIKASKLISKIDIRDANNGTFKTDQFEFRWIYTPATTNLHLSTRNIRGTYVFSSPTDALNHFNILVAG